MRLKPLRKGARVIGGTLLGRIGRAQDGKAAHLNFSIRPVGKGAPRIDPKPILDGWKLLEATAIYRASGRNALYGDDEAGRYSIGQILLLPKPLLEKRVLSDNRIDIYPCGRRDVRAGQIDRRVLATHGLPGRVGPAAHRDQPQVRPRLLHLLGQRLPPLLGQRRRHRQDQRHPDHGPPGARRDHRGRRCGG